MSDNCPYKRRTIITTLLLWISYYYYMKAMWQQMDRKTKVKATKDNCNPTLRNAWRLCREGW